MAWIATLVSVLARQSPQRIYESGIGMLALSGEECAIQLVHCIIWWKLSYPKRDAAELVHRCGVDRLVFSAKADATTEIHL